MSKKLIDPFVMGPVEEHVVQHVDLIGKIWYSPTPIAINGIIFPFAQMFETKEEAANAYGNLFAEANRQAELKCEDRRPIDPFVVRPRNKEMPGTKEEAVNSEANRAASCSGSAADSKSTAISIQELANSLVESRDEKAETELCDGKDITPKEAKPLVIDVEPSEVKNVENGNPIIPCGSNNSDILAEFLKAISGNPGSGDEAKFQLAQMLGKEQGKMEIVEAADEKNGKLVLKETQKGVSVSSYDAMQKLLSIRAFKIVNDVLYFYDGMRYVPMNELEAQRLIVKYCSEDVSAVGTPRFVEWIYDFLLINPKICDKMRDDCNQDYLCFKDGLLNLGSWKFQGHTPNIFVTNLVDDEYNADKPLDCPNFDAFLNTAMQGIPELIERVWQAIGYILTDDIRGKCFFVLQGVTNSGKSTLIRVIQSFFPDDAVAALTINDMGERFGLSAMNCKKLVIGGDLPRTPISDQAVGKLKALTGGDLIFYEAKYKAHAQFLNTSKLLFSTNHPVYLQGYDEAFFNRMVILPFNVSIPKEAQNGDLDKLLQTERHAIIMKALSHYRTLRENNYCFAGKDLAYACSLQCAVTCALSSEQIVENFVENYCEFDEATFTPTEVLFARFKEFCGESDFSVPQKEFFSKQLADVCGLKIKSDRKSINGSKCRGYVGIRLK